MAKILIAGDFCPRGRVEAAFEKGDYSSVLEEICEITSKADYSIVNFECPVVKGNPKPIEKNGPNLRCTSQGVKAIKYAGFNCVTLANNHFFDYGEEGVKETIDTLNKQGVDYVGGGKNLAEASKTLFKNIWGQQLAIINCCENEFSIAKENMAGSNPLNLVKIYHAIKEAKSKAGAVLVIVHGGHEHFQLPSPRMVETYHFFIDVGADAVVNHHQHCYSGYEIYQGKPIFYGLGNFCFDNPAKHSGIWTEGYMVAIDFSEQNPSFEIYPIKQCADKPRVMLLPKDEFDKRLETLNTTIADPIALQLEVNKYYDTCDNKISNIFEPFQNRLYLAAKQRGWLPSLLSKRRKLIAENFILCESHRDKLAHWLLK